MPPHLGNSFLLRNARARLLKDMRQSFTEVINNNENDLFPAERVRNFIDGMLAALGYTQEGNQAKDEGLPDRISGKSVPVYYQVNDSGGAPRLQVLVSLSDSAEAGVLESHRRRLRQGRHLL